MSDLCEVTGYSRDQMRGLIAELPMYADRAERARVAREYSSHDVLVIAICCELETRFGMRRSAVASIAGEVARALVGPRPITSNARLFLDMASSHAAYWDGPVDFKEGMLMQLDPVFARVDGYLAPPWSMGMHDQGNLNLTTSLPASKGAQGRASSDSNGRATHVLGKKKGAV